MYRCIPAHKDRLDTPVAYSVHLRENTLRRSPTELLQDQTFTMAVGSVLVTGYVHSEAIDISDLQQWNQCLKFASGPQTAS